MTSTTKDYRKRMTFIIEFLGGKCVCCNQTTNLRVHHLRDKEFTVSERWSTSLSLLIDELKKCELRCERCHNLIHHSWHGENSYYQSKKCRCISCIEAHRLYVTEYRKRRLLREPTYRKSKRLLL